MKSYAVEFYELQMILVYFELAHVYMIYGVTSGDLRKLQGARVLLVDLEIGNNDIL